MVRKKSLNFNTTLIIIAGLIVIGIITSVYIFKNPINSNTITTTGTAEKTVMPDHVKILLLIETSSDTAEDASSKNSEITNKVLISLDNLGVPNSDIETENYNVYQDYDWINGVQRFKGYKTSNSISITLRNFNKTGVVIDSAISAGALVSYINFDLTQEKFNEYKAQVLTLATQDAKTKAEAIATGVGKKLGKLVSVQASDYNYIPYPLYRAEGSTSSDLKTATTSISPKSLDVSASVSVVYSII